MKTIKITTAFFIVLAILTGCKNDFLQDGSLAEGPVTTEENWANDNYARGVLNNAYFSVQDRYNLDGNGAMQASGTDEAVNSNLNSSISTFNNGTWSPVRTIDDTYNDLYEGLRKVNLFMENVQKSGITAQPSELTSATSADQTWQAQIDRLKGQAFFLRAYFHFELLERYGSLVLATRTFQRDENLNLPRNTLEECVNQIALDCDSAIALLPAWTQSWSTGQRGRATQTAAMALKSRTFLYAASPQYNTNGDLAKWQKAANAAKALIDKNLHSLMTSYNNVFLFGANPYNNEAIFQTQTPNRNDIEQNNAPVSYDGGLGRTNPTQEMVDAFEMKSTGRLITDPSSGYNQNTPYNNRDSRLGFTVHYNGYSYKNKAVETFIGGKDGIGANVNATKTGYYMRKFFNDAVSWNQASNTLSRRPWIIFRYAEVLLNYAEALNEAQGPVADVYKYVNMIRQRTGVALPALQSTNPTGNGYVPATKEAMRLRIQNERRVELCFEGHRFFDVRRWKKGEEFLNKPVTGMRITKNPTTSALTYERFEVEKRVFSDKNYLYPISQSNLNRAPALGQNPGY